jgi:hypothetical protein
MKRRKKAIRPKKRKKKAVMNLIPLLRLEGNRRRALNSPNRAGAGQSC